MILQVRRAMPILEIETTNRWDALALAGKLPRYHWYLVQPDRVHWEVCIPVDEPVTSLPSALRRAVEAWLRERQLGAATIRAAGGRTFEVGRPG
jgi:hypothetical protein